MDAVPIFLALGIALWAWALWEAPLPGYLDLQSRQIVRIIAGLAALVVAGCLALIRAVT